MGYYDDDDLNHSTNQGYTADSEPLSIWSWVCILFLLVIPFLNILALFFIAFGVENKNLSNFAKAALILAALALIFSFLTQGFYRF